MAQLKMYWRGTEPVFYPVPDGFEYRNFNGSREDIKGWLDICKCGIISADKGEDEFRRRITDFDIDMDPLTDVFIFTRAGEYAATITAMLHHDLGAGYIHMVASKPEFRGLGLGNAMNTVALKKLYYQGCGFAYLTTDDYRLAAIKSYINQNFLPVIYDIGMEQRWARVIGKLGIKKIDMLTDKGDFAKTIFADTKR